MINYLPPLLPLIDLHNIFNFKHSSYLISLITPSPYQISSTISLINSFINYMLFCLAPINIILKSIINQDIDAYFTIVQGGKILFMFSNDKSNPILS
jgi:hypothetical protein